METTQVLRNDEALAIRTGDLSDIPVIQRIAREAWHAAYGDIISEAFITHELAREYSEAALKDQMSESAHTFLMAELADGTVVGFASYGELASVSELSGAKRLAKLYKLYLLPELKGKGYGSALVNAVIARCGQTGYEQLNLSVNRGNPAVAFYQRQGFSVLKEEDIVVGPGFVRHDYVMGKTLSLAAACQELA